MSATLFRSHYRVDLTAKQRQVLELVARGKTNFEIAQELGISLDGAKWHLRELFAKLDVGSREEAAEWWREYNAPRQRLARAVRGLLPATVGKWLLAGGVSAVVVVGIAVAVIVALGNRSGGDQQAGATVTVSPTPNVSATASTTPPPEPSNTPSNATPGPSSPPEVVAGLPVQPMTSGDPVPLPQGVVVWYRMAQPYTDGGSNVLTRAWRDSTGELHKRDVLESLALGRSVSVVGDDSMAHLVAAVCPEGLCGLGVSAQLPLNPRAITVSAPRQAALSDQLLYRSDDGGITWNRFGTIPGGTYILGVAGGQVLIGDYRAATPGSYRGTFSLYPSGNKITPPTGLSDPYPIRVTDSGIQWTENAAHGAVYGPDGGVLFAPGSDAFTTASFLGALPDGESFFTWVGSEERPGQYIARIGTDGKPEGIFSAQTWWGRPLSADLLIGTLLQPESDVPMDAGIFGLALFDLQAKTISPIEGMFNTTAFGATAFLMTAVAGAFAMVDTPGDCLNVREDASASSKSLGCFADGVLLSASDVIGVVDGEEWQSVTTPSGEAGWANAAFLVR